VTAQEVRGAALGSLTAAAGFGALLAGAGGGYLWQTAGPATAFVVASVTILFGLLLLIVAKALRTRPA
jgi:hypothetical protein